MQIRPAEPADVDALYEICLRTGDRGRDASGILADPRLIGHVYVGPYLALEPSYAFVLADELGAVGYVLGALDTRAFDVACEARWWPPLRDDYPDPALNAGWSGLAGATTDDELAFLVHHPPVSPDEVVGRFPSHLHIDRLPRAQGRGYGAKMIDTLLGALSDAGSPGVHAGVAAANIRAIGFYRTCGFVDVITRPSDLILAHGLPRPSPPG